MNYRYIPSSDDFRPADTELGRDCNGDTRASFSTVFTLLSKTYAASFFIRLYQSVRLDQRVLNIFISITEGRDSFQLEQGPLSMENVESRKRI